MSELHRLSRCYGFAGEFKSLTEVVKAAQFRVACRENKAHGGLHVRSRSRAMAEARRSTIYVDREFRWRRWYDEAHCVTLRTTMKQFEDAGITEQVVEDTAAGNKPRPWTKGTQQIVSRNFQRTARALLARRDMYDPGHWTREKLSRWGLRDRRQADRSLARLRSLGSEVPPRVMAATIGCIWNRWPTARRLQRRGYPCLLGCGVGEDSIQHYACCRLTRDAACRWLGIRYRFSGPFEHWMLAAPTCVEIEGTPKWWGHIALLLYSVQRVTISLRHARDPPLVEAEVRRALRQGLVEGARGHPAATRLLSRRALVAP